MEKGDIASILEGLTDRLGAPERENELISAENAELRAGIAEPKASGGAGRSCRPPPRTGP